MMDYHAWAALFILVTVLGGMIRVLRGPTRADRMLAAQLFSTAGVAIALLLGASHGAQWLNDVALVFALLSAMATTAFVRLAWHPDPHGRRRRMVPNSESAAMVLIGIGALFFLAGSLGLLRFPDVYSRLHALTKADNVGLGLVVAGLALQAESGSVAFKLVLVWLLVTYSSATACYLVAQAALRMGIKPWEKS